MKCPKCAYLGFETGDRCRNCGYDFSLMAPAPEAVPDLDLTLSGSDASPADLSSFPLFPAPGEDDDTPLITLPSKPRAPLSVRRTPDQARRRTTPRAVRQVGSDLVLDFAPETGDADGPPISEASSTAGAEPEPARTDVVASLARRAVAALTDHVILFGVDVIVAYCTLRIVALTMGDWRQLPAVPFLAFLFMLKFAYFSAFTAMGGQTIGKMAAGIRVVADDHLTMDGARALRRTITGVVALLPLGLGLVPAFVDPGRRALHDRVAHTRVVELPSA